MSYGLRGTLLICAGLLVYLVLTRNNKTSHARPAPRNTANTGKQAT